MTEPTALVAHSEDPNQQAALAKVRALLVPGEEVLSFAVQRRLFALLRRRELVVATTGRVIRFSRHLLPGATVIDLRWQDLRDAHLKEGIFGTDLSISGSQSFVVHGLRKDEAQKLYRLCQEQEQAWREKNRVRGLEEARARSGGVQINSGAAAAPPAEDATTRLRKAKAMLDQGLINDAEYEALKAKILAEI